MQTGKNTRLAGNKFNTLAQTRTAQKVPLKGKDPVFVMGIGTELNNEKAAKGRAKRKMITVKRTLKLVDVAKRKKNKIIRQQFWNTFHCQRTLTTAEGKQFSCTCKNRFCLGCCSIRKAVIINKYFEVISKWEKPYLVGLTVKSVPANKLKWLIDAMYRAWDRIIAKHQKRARRGKGFLLKGIKALESNFNPNAQTYNPHFHILVPDKETGDILVNEWCSLWPSKYVNREAQYCEPVRSKGKALIELIKYGTKVFTEPDIDKKLQNKDTAKIYAAALYNILNAMNGHRIFDRFGFNLPKQITNKPKGGTLTLVTNYINWQYDLKCFDWVGEDTAGTLTNYQPPPDLLYILDQCIDVLLE